MATWKRSIKAVLIIMNFFSFFSVQLCHTDQKFLSDEISTTFLSFRWQFRLDILYLKRFSGLKVKIHEAIKNFYLSFSVKISWIILIKLNRNCVELCFKVGLSAAIHQFIILVNSNVPQSVRMSFSSFARLLFKKFPFGENREYNTR